jgi:uncharacterized damage-inducible protein DinB
MDQISTLERMFRYKAWANDEMLTAMKKFDDTARTEGLPMNDREIAMRILNHTYIVDQIFAANLRRIAHSYDSPNAAEVPTLEELSRAIRASDEWYVDYVTSINQTDLAEKIDFTFTDGAPGRMSREEMLMHVALHGGGHRGQLGLLMMKNAITPPADLFTGYLHKAEPSLRRRA